MKESIDLYQNEQELLNKGYKYIAGTDEAGRGCLIGPVYAAAVILDPSFKIEGINDSKQLSAKKREELYPIIKEKALAWSISLVDAKEIDRINIYNASKKAMEMALATLKIKPDYVLIDTMKLAIDVASSSLIHGDALSASIGAASILAKVERDHYLDELDKIYPEYNLKNNKGYSTKEHLEALKKYGITPLHRRSYRPVEEAMNLHFDLK